MTMGESVGSFFFDNSCKHCNASFQSTKKKYGRYCKSDCNVPRCYEGVVAITVVAFKTIDGSAILIFFSFAL